MIDNLSILLSHGWLILAFWLLLQRTDLNSEPAPTPDAEPQGFGKRPGAKQQSNPFRKQRAAKPVSGKDDADA